MSRSRPLDNAPWTRSTWARNMAVHKNMAAWSERLPSFYLQLPPEASPVSLPGTPPQCLWSGHRGCSWPGARLFNKRFRYSCRDGRMQAQRTGMSLSPLSLSLPPYGGNENCRKPLFRRTLRLSLSRSISEAKLIQHSIEGPLRVSHCSSNRGS